MIRITNCFLACFLTFTMIHAGIDAAEISILSVGDITIGSELTFTIETKGADSLFAGTADLLKNADITVGTLESSISDRGEPKFESEYAFRAVHDVARGLANAGFDVLSLATPHIMDYGAEALEDTIKFLSQYNVGTVGAGSYLQAARKPTVLTVKDTKVSFLAYYHTSQYSTQYADEEHPGPMLASFSLMKQDIAQAAKEADIVVVSIHWGVIKSEDTITERQQFFAHNIIDFGADLVLGQQLHALKGIELYKGKAIVYSLADFIFELYDKQHSKIVIPKFYFQDGKLKQIELTPVWVDNPDAKYQPQLLHEKAAQKTLQKYQKLCAALNTRMEIEGGKGWIRR
ncbi:TPA: CapA family protein [Candidatus Poribacteria bacterium]|nr:CapA family protein [Candidatus Poribacteria bacterium]